MKDNIKHYTTRKLNHVKSFISPFPYTRQMINGRYIFIHVPKTAGTSVLSVLGAPLERRHINWRIYQQANRFYFDEFYKFSIVRHPLNRIISSYNYIRDGGNGLANDLNLSEYINKIAPNFDIFVREYLSHSNILLHNLFRPQAFYLCDYRGKVMVDQVCKLENIDSDFIVLQKNLGIQGVKLPLINRSNSSGSKVNFSLETVKLIHELYKIDYEVFDYDIYEK